ncbi:MAG: peptidase S8, partial [Flavobacteriaceae bacterium]
MRKKIFLFFGLFFLYSCAPVKFVGTPLTLAQGTMKKSSLTNQEEQEWAFLDFPTDSIPGMSITRAFDELIQSKTGKEVVVAIIDSGVDTLHPALA